MKRLFFTILVVFCSLGSFAQNTFMRMYNDFETDAWTDQVLVLTDGYVISGVCIKDNIYQLFLIKTNLNGDKQWIKYYDYGITEPGTLSASDKDAADNMYFAFENSPSANLIKISPTGDVLWAVNFDGDIHQVQYLANNELLIASAFSNSINLKRVDPSSGALIVESVNITGTTPLMVTTMSLLSDDTIVLSVSTSDMGNPTSVSTLYNIPFTFDTVYSSQMQYTETIVHRAASVVNDEVISVGHIAQYATTDNRSYISGYTTSGDVEFARLITYPARQARLFKQVLNNQNQIIALGKYSTNDDPGKVLLRGMNINGDSLWTSLLLMNEPTVGYDLELANDGGYVVTGRTFIDQKDVPVLIKTNTSGQMQPLGSKDIDHDNYITVYPNPATEQVVFEYPESTGGNIMITDITGHLCTVLKITGLRTIFNTTLLKPGLYFYTIKTSNSLSTGKVLIK